MTPVEFLKNWSYDGWCAAGFVPNRKTRVADALLWKWYVGKAVARVLFRWQEDDFAGFEPAWQRALLRFGYRLKAALCLLVGRHFRTEDYPGRRYDSAVVSSWDGEMVGYYEPEYEESTLEVGMGFGNWRVYFHERRLWP